MRIDGLGLRPGAAMRMGVDHAGRDPFAARVDRPIAWGHRQGGTDGSGLASLHQQRAVRNLLARRGAHGSAAHRPGPRGRWAVADGWMRRASGRERGVRYRSITVDAVGFTQNKNKTK